MSLSLKGLEKAAPAGTRKTLVLIRHSKIDAEKNTTSEGMDMATDFGGQLNGIAHYFFCVSHLFFGPLARCAQTALAVLAGYLEASLAAPVAVHSPVYGLGDESLFREIVTGFFNDAVGKGMNNFRATKAAHPLPLVREWAQSCLDAAEFMFSQMDVDEREGETQGLGIFHSPTIELLVWAIVGFGHLPVELQDIKELEGVVLYQDAAGEITVARKKVSFRDDEVIDIPAE